MRGRFGEARKKIRHPLASHLHKKSIRTKIDLARPVGSSLWGKLNLFEKTRLVPGREYSTTHQWAEVDLTRLPACISQVQTKFRKSCDLDEFHNNNLEPSPNLVNIPSYFELRERTFLAHVCP